MSRLAIVAEQYIAVRDAIARQMEDAGFDVVAVQLGAEVKALAPSLVPEVLIFGLLLPDGDAFHVLSALRQTLPSGRGGGPVHAPAILVTDWSSDSIRADAQRAGFAAVLSPPGAMPHLAEGASTDPGQFAADVLAVIAAADAAITAHRIDMPAPTRRQRITALQIRSRELARYATALRKQASRTVEDVNTAGWSIEEPLQLRLQARWTAKAARDLRHSLRQMEWRERSEEQP